MTWWDFLTDGAKKNLYMNVADILGNADEAAKAIMEAFGLKEEDVKPYVDDYFNYLSEEEKRAIEEYGHIEPKTTDNSDLFDWFLDLFGGRFNPPDEIEMDVPAPETEQFTSGLDDMVEDTKNAVNEIDDLFYELRDTINLSDLNLHDKNEAIDKIIELKTQGQIEELQSLIDYINQYGIEEGLKTFEEFGNGLGGVRNPMRMSAAGMTVSDVGWTPSIAPVDTTSGVVQTEPKDNQQEVSNMAAGVRSGTAEVVSELQSVVMQLTRLLAKEWKVVVSPSQDWSQHNRRSEIEHERAYGETPF